ANTMFTAVLERSRQIGILKAVGTSSNEVMVMFLLESGLMGFIGGALGCVAGILLAIEVSSLGVRGFLPGGGRGAPGGGTLQLVVTPNLLIMALSVATLIGAVAGLLPAMRAARLQPVETLRGE
ncbi:MAG: ABC transporter permease, partial [Thermoplasmatota archaeon]